MFLDCVKSNLIIGSGAEASVVLGRSSQDGQVIALKISNNDAFHKNLRKESNLLLGFDHPNIVKVRIPYQLSAFKAGPIVETRALLGLELSIEGSVFEYLFVTKQPLPRRIAKYYMMQLLEAVAEIHEHQIVHQDLKLENFLLYDCGRTLKVADFGLFADLNPVLEKKISQESPKTRVTGTYSYMAPECLVGEKGFASDIFSMMVAAFVMVYGFIPFNSAKSSDKMYKLILMKNEVEYAKNVKKLAGSLDPVFMDLFTKCVAFKPSDRPTLQEIKNHAWFSSEIGSEDEAVVYVQAHFKTVRSDFLAKLATLDI